MAWTCSDCGRTFHRARQSHVCEPATTVDAWFERRPPADRKICDAVVRHLRKLGPLTVEAVEVGILIKRGRTFCELRPRREGLMLSIILPRVARDARVTRVIEISGERVAHFVHLRSAKDVDAQLRSWLTEGYACAAINA